MAVKRTSITAKRREQASSLTKLRKLGLTKAKPPAGKRLGGSAYSVLRKFSQVLQGKAAVVSAPKDVVAKYRSTFSTTRTKIVVPKSAGEQVRLARGLVQKRKVVTPGAPAIHVSIPPRLTGLTGLPRGPGYRYRVNYGTSRILFDDYESLAEFLDHYGPNHKFNVGFIEVIPPSRNRRQRGNDDDDESDDE